MSYAIRGPFLVEIESRFRFVLERTKFVQTASIWTVSDNASWQRNVDDHMGFQFASGLVKCQKCKELQNEIANFAGFDRLSICADSPAIEQFVTWE